MELRIDGIGADGTASNTGHIAGFLALMVNIFAWLTILAKFFFIIGNWGLDESIVKDQITTLTNDSFTRKADTVYFCN